MKGLFGVSCLNTATEIALAAARGSAGIVPVFLPLDLETTTPTVDGKPNPMPYGAKGATVFAGGYGPARFYKSPDLVPTIASMMATHTEFRAIVCGHNLKFDFQHLFQSRGPMPTLIWDTMVAEYILTGQQAQMASLSDLQAKYGLTVKKDLISTNLANGVTPDQIPENELMEYLDYDLASVETIARAQFVLAVSRGCVPLILTQGLAMLAYAYAEYNGMTLDIYECVTRRDTHAASVGLLTQAIAAQVRSVCAVPDEVPDAELTKPRVLSMAFWGVPTSANIKVPLGPGDVARGNHKSKTVIITAPPHAKAVPFDVLGLSAQDLRTRNAWLKVDDAVLDKICVGYPKSVFGDLAATVLSWRHHSKLLGTYYQPLLEHASKFGDATVHHTINQCIAHTGRTTSERPNGQNMPSGVREVIVPPSGGLLEVDFRQLEISALAQISGDEALIAALKAGDDIHYLTGQLVYGYKSKDDETPERRRIIKTINFGLAYGGGAFTLAEQAGVDVQTARNAIEAFYRRFPDTKTYNDKYFEEVAHSPESIEVHPPNVDQRPCTHRAHTMNSCTGRRYVYTEQDTPDWLYHKTGALVSFSPTQTKNYPVQGFATGDIVPLVAGLFGLTRYSLRNLIHDSLLFSYANDSERDQLVEAIEELADLLPTIINIIWPNIRMQVPLRVEIKTGPNWGTLSPLIESLE